MSQLQLNLAYLIAKHDTNPTQLAKATGVPQPTIKRILDGTSQKPHDVTLAPLAQHFGLTAYVVRYARLEEADQDIEGEEAKKIVYWVSSEREDKQWVTTPGDNVEAAPLIRPFKNVPIVGTVEGGPEGYLEEAGYPVGHGDGLVEFPAKDTNAYALRVRGESMRPRIKSGEFIIVEPNSAANPGDDVVVICKDGRKMVKELLYIRDGEVTLGSINNGFKPLSIPLEEIDAMHYVAAIVPRGAFYKPT